MIMIAKINVTEVMTLDDAIVLVDLLFECNRVTCSRVYRLGAFAS